MRKLNFSLSRLVLTLRTTKRYWIPLFILVVGGANFAGLLLPKKYCSTGLVKIHNPQMKDLAQNMSRLLSLEDRLATIRNEITSHSFLAGVAHKLGIGAEYPTDSAQYDLLIKRMQSRVELTVTGQDLFTVSYTSESPEEAKNVADEIVQRYKDASSAYYEDNTKKAVDYIQAELNSAEKELQADEEKLTAYKKSHINELPEIQEGQLQRLEKRRGELEVAQGELQSMNEALTMGRAKLLTIPASIDAETMMQQTDGGKDLLKQKKELEMQLQGLLQTYTNEHWQVKELKSRIALLDAELNTAKDDKVTSVKKAPNPARQSMEEKIMILEMDIQKRQSQIEQIKRDITQLETYRNNVPQRRQELESIQQVRDSVRDRVGILRKNLEQAKLAKSLEKEGQGPSFEVSDPPRVPTAPCSPNRQKIAMASVALGGMITGGFLYMMTLMDSVVRSVEEARTLLQMPVLGVMQRITTAAQQARVRRRRLRRALGWGTGLALVIGGVLIGLLYYREPLAQQIEALRKLLSQW